MRDKILETFPELTNNDVRSTSSGVTGRDVQLSEAALRVFPFAIECKSRSKIAVYDYYDQASTHAKDGELPLLVIKQNYSEPLVVLSLDDFMELYAGKKKD